MKDFDMKNIVKQTFMGLSLAMLAAAPSFAAEITKGTKSYQIGADKSEEQAAAQKQPDDVSKIAPAAGDQEPVENAAEKSFKDELRLPRKN